MAQNLAQIQFHIEERLNDLLNLPNRIQGINTNLIGQGYLNVKNLRSWRITLYEQAQTFKGLSSIMWGGADGWSVGIAGYPGVTGYEFVIRDDKTAGNLHKYYCDRNGRMDERPISSIPYDPRSRPWYQTAMRAGKPIWTDIYARARRNGSRAMLALGYAQPFRDINGKFIGVMNAELTLNDITLFLEKLSIGRTGKAFLIDQKGRLIATSSGIPLTDAKNYPVIASAAADRQIAKAAMFLEKEFGSYKSIEARYQLGLRINNRPYFLMISPSEHETGLTWLIATLVPENDFLTDIKAGRRQSIRIGLVAVLITLLFGIFLAVVSNWPMRDLVSYVNKIGRGELEHELKLEYSAEFVQLSKKINAMTAGLRDRMRLRHSLALAQEVQQNLLPSGRPRIDGLDIAGHATYCDETGGDYFDFLTIAGLPETTAAIAVGDVVGHGVAAAMLMATARGILRSRCRTPGSLAELLTHLNELLVDDTGGDRFMTMLLLTVDPERCEMRWASAGHDAPLVYDPTDDRFIEFTGSGVSLGLVRGVDYEESVFTQLRPGHVIVALTDGLWEAFNQRGEMFGKNRVRNLIRRFAGLSSDEISQRLIIEFSNFLEGKSPADDLTYVIVKVK
jgi:serine phosphatase RsbU (regulator of sigma subunit)